MSWIFSAACRSTDTSFEMPRCSIVIPKSRSIRAIVMRWCVIIRNRVPVWSQISRRRSQNRTIFESSSGASTSSSTQIGAGFVKKTANMIANAVKACSPPDNNERDWRRFPGGLARISRPASNGSSALVSCSSAVPPPKRFLNRVLKLTNFYNSYIANQNNFVRSVNNFIIIKIFLSE